MEMNMSFVGTAMWHLAQLLVLIYFAIKGMKNNEY